MSEEGFEDDDEDKLTHFTPLHMLSDATEVYERLQDLITQAQRQRRRIEHLQIEFDRTPVDQNRRIGHFVDAAKGRLHLLNLSIEAAEEKLIEVSLPFALILERELKLQLIRLKDELLLWTEKFNKTNNGKFKERRDETQERIDLVVQAHVIARCHQSVSKTQYFEFWNERVEWLLESKLKHALKVHGVQQILELSRSFNEVERMEKHLHADKQQGVFHKVLLIIKYLQLFPQVQVVDISVNNKIGNWANLLVGAILNESPPHIVAARAIVRAKHKKVDIIVKPDAVCSKDHVEEHANSVPPPKRGAGVTGDYNLLSEAMRKMELSPHPRIHSINLSRCFIEDGTIEALSNALTENFSLTWLNVANNAFTYKGLAHLATALVQNQTLTHIDLTGNDLTKTGFDHRPLEAFTRSCGRWVHSIRLRGCSIYFRGALAFASLRPHSVRTLNLSCNYITDDGAAILAETFLPLQKNLKRFDLSECYIRGRGFLALMSVFSDTKRRPVYIQTLDLSGNIITDSDIISLATDIIPAIGEASVIGKFIIIRNCFTLKMCQAFADALVVCPFAAHIHLEEAGGSTTGPYGGCITPENIIQSNGVLKINNLALGDICGAVIARMLLHNVTLSHIDLSCNRLGLASAVILAEVIADHADITHLDLSCNNIDSSSPAILPVISGKNAYKIINTISTTINR